MAPEILPRIHRFLPLVVLLAAPPGCNTPPQEEPSWRSEFHGFPPPPPGIQKMCVGVPPIHVGESGLDANVGNVAADLLITILVQTKRFDVLEREELRVLLREEDGSPLFRDGSAARPARKVLQALLLGKVKRLSVRPHRGAPPSGSDGRDRRSWVDLDCAVELRLVDPRTGSVVAGGTGRIERVATIHELGIRVLGITAGEPEECQVSADDQGKILRLVLYPTLERMLPEIDAHLVREAGGPGAPTPTPPPTSRFCTCCGYKLEPGLKFCPSCGERLR